MAPHDPGKQVLRPPAGGHLAPRAPQPCLGRIPRALVDDGQLGMLGDHPFALWALLAHTAPGVGVLDPAAAVPDLPASIDGVRQDPDAAALVAVDGGHGPGATAGRWHVVARQAGGDLAGAAAGQVLGEDPTHCGCLLGVDGALTGRGHPVAIGQAAGAGAGERPTGEPAVCLVAQVIQVQLTHQAAQADPQLVRLVGGVDGITHRDHPHAAELEPAHLLLHFHAVARKAGQVVQQDHVEQVRVGQQFAVAGPIVARA
nr:hypothetical protein [Pseudoxanthomonas winnipegensis]